MILLRRLMLAVFFLSLTMATQAAVTGSTTETIHMKVHVVATYPHDKAAFTQGLLWDGSHLYESTGLEQQSSVRRVELATGKVLQSIALDPTLFGEGMTEANGNLIQITWQNHRAFVYDKADFSTINEFAYQGEGWGITFDGKRLIMSDGASMLTFRDPNTFAVMGQVAVARNGVPVTHLNELEYVEGFVYANIWLTNTIVKIDPATGRVVADIDASGLLTTAEKPGTDVLNGIAWNSETRHFYVTGKLWPHVFEVVFVPTSSEISGAITY